MERRAFVKKAAITSAGLSLAPTLITSCKTSKKPWFTISLAEWSLHRALEGKMTDNLEFPVVAKRDFGITAVEYVNTFFKPFDVDAKYLAEIKRSTTYHQITNVLIMVDGEGNLGASDEEERQEAIENHNHWVDVARTLGCHSIRVNASGPGDADELGSNVVKGLFGVCEYAARDGINVIVENHGGFSSDASWLSKVIKTVNLPNCGTLPDFGNFNISAVKEYDRYKGVEELMPYAKGVSAKTYDFDNDGNETTIDFDRMMKIVRKSGYRGHIGIEYEGDNNTEEEGIMLTKRLLERYL